MMHRFLCIPVLCALCVAASADVIVLKSGKIMGLRDKAQDGTPINANNWANYLGESDLEITAENYDGLQYARGRGTDKIAWSQVSDYDFSNVPSALSEGKNQMSIGNYRQALAAFQQLIKDGSARPVFKVQAQFQMARCWIALGNFKSAQQQLASWDHTSSIHTPDVYYMLGQLDISQREFDQARKDFAKIGQLPGLPEAQAYRARLGAIQVDIAESKAGDAETKAKLLVAELLPKQGLNDVMAQALVLQGKAILASGDAKRAPQAQSAGEKAKELSGESDSTEAGIYNLLGDSIYAQHNPNQARFAYMRVWLLYPVVPGEVAHAIHNAGQCFIDLAGNKKLDQQAQDDHLIKGMQLLGLCLNKYGGSPEGKAARQAYREHARDYEAAKARSAKEASEKKSQAKGPK